MILSLYTAKLKCLLRDRESLFWALLFPLFLAIIYYLAFSGLSKNDSLTTINIAAVSVGSDKEKTLLQTLEEAAYENDLNIFNVTLTSKEEAIRLLDNNKVSAYVIMSDIPELVVKSSNIKSTVAKNVLDSYMQMYGVADIIIRDSTNENLDFNVLMDDMVDRNYFLSERESVQKKNMDYTVIYFYALLGMVCIYGGNWGIREGTDISASLSSKGARIQISPYSLVKLMFCNLFAALTIHMAGVMIVLVFMKKILNIDFGDQMHLVILTCFLGSIIGILLGCMTAVAVKANEKKKDAILTCITLVWGFLAGLMIPQIKYIVASKIPALVFINPVHLITDGLYSLYYYEGLERYAKNIGYLLITIIVYSGIIIYSMRRNKSGNI